MKYLFDTDVIVELLRRAPCPALLRHLAATPVDAQATSSITVAELFAGAHRGGSGMPDLVARLERALLPNLAVLPFDVDAARVYGELHVSLDRDGVSLSEADAQVASIALAHDLVVVTAEGSRFARIPALVIEDWFA